jgi:hypothetical protein
MSGWAATPVEAVVLLALGWWARNFRSPSRRAMYREVVADSDRPRAFGFLHSLDVGGALLAGMTLLILVSQQMSFRLIFTLAIIPLGVSTVMLARAQAGRRSGHPPVETSHPTTAGSSSASVYRGVLIAAALYGFSTYSIGFPILTVAQGIRSTPAGIGAFVFFQGVSALTGFLVGRHARATLPELAGGGYFAAALGSAGLGLAYGFHLSVLGFVVPMALLGFALGVIETLEPTLVARFVPTASAGRGLGGLTGARSLGLFAAIVFMGLLYHWTPVYAYSYATAMALVAMGVVLAVHGRHRQIPTSPTRPTGMVDTAATGSTASGRQP